MEVPSPFIDLAMARGQAKRLLRVGPPPSSTNVSSSPHLAPSGGRARLAGHDKPHWTAVLMEASNTFRNEVMSAIFMIGLVFVAFEDFIGVNKSAVTLFLAGVMWAFLYLTSAGNAGSQAWVHKELDRGLQQVGAVVLFLLPAMGIVESMDHFDGFGRVSSAIKRQMSTNRNAVLPIICAMTFGLSSIIDNLTSTIVALKILRHCIGEDLAFRRRCGGLAVVTANAGGAWSPIGDVTTTMLWISDKISVPSTVAFLFLPSLVAGFVPVAGTWWQLAYQSRQEEARGETTAAAMSAAMSEMERAGSKASVASDKSDGVMAMFLGVLLILMVPVLKMTTGLPPYLGMLLALGVFWMLTDWLALRPAGDFDAEDSDSISTHTGPPTKGVVLALSKVDLTGLFFFTGVLLAVGALDSAGILDMQAQYLLDTFGNSPVVVCTMLGMSSAFVDNIPLVQATIDMFDPRPMDDSLWQLTALAAGTGGSMLSVGSIAGVTLMSTEGVGFLWYIQNISFWAAVGFAMSIATYQLELMMFVR